MTLEQARMLQKIGKAIIETAIESAPIGAPGGHIYAALMAQGCTLHQYEQIMSGLTRAGMLTKDGECYLATDKGRTFAGMSA